MTRERQSIMTKNLKGPNNRTRPIVATDRVVSRASIGVRGSGRQQVSTGPRHSIGGPMQWRELAVGDGPSSVRPKGGCLSSGSALVLVDDAAEDVATDDLAVSGGRECGAGERWVEIETAVGPG